MFYIVDTKLPQAPWAETYASSLCSALNAQGAACAVIYIDDPIITSLSEKDYLLIVDYKDIDNPVLLETKAKKLAQINGTSANPYCYQVNYEEEKRQFEKVLDYAIAFNERVADGFNALFPRVKIITAGFPLPLTVTENKKVKGRIVIGGRVSPDKQFYLATYLLSDLINEGYEVIFSYAKDSDEEWLKKYNKENFERLGFKFYRNTCEEFNALLRSAEFYFICSLGDTSSVSVAEAYAAGCKVIAPSFNKGIPSYDDYLSCGYEPFSKSSVENLIKSDTRVEADLTNYSPDFCAKKLIEYLNL